MRKLVLALLLCSSSLCLAQTAATSDAATFAADLSRYEVHTNIVYHTANNYEAKLDVYLPARSTPAAQPTPVVIVIHGGGWIAGTKEERVFEVLPYLQMGFAAVNVEYRMAQVSLAPAAVEDCRCALHWVFANAKRFNFDPTRVVLQGGSAGGHLHSPPACSRPQLVSIASARVAPKTSGAEMQLQITTRRSQPS